MRKSSFSAFVAIWTPELWFLSGRRMSKSIVLKSPGSTSLSWGQCIQGGVRGRSVWHPASDIQICRVHQRWRAWTFPSQLIPACCQHRPRYCLSAIHFVRHCLEDGNTQRRIHLGIGGEGRKGSMIRIPIRFLLRQAEEIDRVRQGMSRNVAIEIRNQMVGLVTVRHVVHPTDALSEADESILPIRAINVIEFICQFAKVEQHSILVRPMCE